MTVTWLLDTHVLLWALATPERLPAAVRQPLEDTGQPVAYSAVSIWEIAIKAAIGRVDFVANAGLVADHAIKLGWRELPVSACHAARVAHLPPIHNDPFDRLLVAQAQVTGYTLITADQTVANYPGSIRLI